MVLRPAYRTLEEAGGGGELKKIHKERSVPVLQFYNTKMDEKKRKWGEAH